MPEFVWSDEGMSIVGAVLYASLVFVAIVLAAMNRRLLRIISEKETHINQLQYSIQRSQSAAEIWKRMAEERTKETVHG